MVITDYIKWKSQSFRSLLGPFIAICLITYFVYHIFQGERGIISWLRLQKKIYENEQILSDLQNQKSILEHQVSLLQPNSIDQDMLEERARLILNFAEKNEVIIQDSDIVAK